MSAGPLVSVVLPVHDGEQYLAAAIDSILSQTHANLELIVIDDGSRDSSAAIAASFAADPRLRVVRNERNLGLVATLNRGLGLARGEFIARMDADDVAAPERLALQLQRMIDDPGIAVLGTNITFADATGSVVGRPRSLPCGPALVRWRLLRGTCLYHPTVMLRRAALGDERYSAEYIHAEDYDLWLRLSRRHRLDNLPQSLLLHRRHGQSVSARHLETQLDSAARSLRGHVQECYGLALTPGQARALLDPRAFLERRSDAADSPVPVVRELERRFGAVEAGASPDELRAVRRDVAFVCWKFAALCLMHWRDGVLPARRVRMLVASAVTLLGRPIAAVSALYGDQRQRRYLSASPRRPGTFDVTK
jgi:glycosyltransferase involved in cell wall biosynthesis